MDPLSILIWTAVWAGVSAGIYVTVYFANLTFQIVFNWFRQFAYLITANDRSIPIRDRSHLSATVFRNLQNDDFNVITIDYNQRTGEVEDAKVMQAGSVDYKIQQAHDYGRKEVAIWSF
jgi:hypothetical protein